MNKEPRKLAVLRLTFSKITRIETTDFAKQLEKEGWSTQDEYYNHEQGSGHIQLRREIK